MVYSLWALENWLCELEIMAQIPLPIRLDIHARFSTFVAGENQVVLDHLLGISAGQRAQILWIWGPSGSGKSHLLQALCTSENDSGRPAIFLPMKSPGLPGPGVLDGLEALDLVAIDDVEQIAGVNDWEHALFALYNELLTQEGCLLMTASRPPSVIAFSLPDLASRAAGAVVYRLEPLGEDAVLIALKEHASCRGLELPDASAHYLMRHVERNMSALCGSLEKLDVASMVSQRRLTVPFIRDVLEI